MNLWTQRQRWLPDMAAGIRRGCFSLSEPDSGSDAAALRCRAERDGDEWVINGTKMWVTNGERAGMVALLARTPDDGITCFLVDKQPGPEGDGGITISVSTATISFAVWMLRIRFTRFPGIRIATLVLA